MEWKSAAVEDIGGRRRAASSNIGDCVSPYQTSRCAALRCSWVRVRIEGVCMEGIIQRNCCSESFRLGLGFQFANKGINGRKKGFQLDDLN